MFSWFERSIFLRPLNFLRVRHPHDSFYNWTLPTLLACASQLLLYSLDYNSAAIFVRSSVEALISLLSVFVPFYVASLAAVATFNGPEKFDDPFEMQTPVTLEITGEFGGSRTLHISPRYFLCLLFGYNAIISILLLLSCVVLSTYFEVVSETNVPAVWSFTLAWLPLQIMFFQTSVFLLMAIYYLADYVHRLRYRS
ncbi:hypothetical protein GCM10011392_08160 [Wenxinia marina]|nr:hypothetical protein GCM10011392_08160 [Wenxinia marina]